MKFTTRLTMALLPTTLGLLTLGVSVGQAADYPAPGDFQRGAKTWSENCARCHNIRGPRELRDDQWISTIFHMRVRAGLTGQESRDVLTFLQASNTTPASIGAAPATQSDGASVSGQAIFRQTCVACHGIDGKGVLPGVPDFTLGDGPLSKQDAILIKHITEGFQSPGAPMAMPPKGGNPDLNVDDIQAVLGYLRDTFGK